jgi:hypothetical protein
MMMAFWLHHIMTNGIPVGVYERKRDHWWDMEQKSQRHCGLDVVCPPRVHLLGFDLQGGGIGMMWNL